MAVFSPSELILNDDGSIYHLHLQPEQLADTIITVGDPGRVPLVSKYFDQVEHRVEKREFVTHTGRLGAKRLTVISTGIGPDNIDIVLNELDALANIDLATRQVKPQLRRLSFIRLGTSGSVQAHIPVDSLLFSAYGLGLDNLMAYYLRTPSADEVALEAGLAAFVEQNNLPLPVRPYATQANAELLEALSRPGEHRGITLTAPGFYGPQGRWLRAGGRFGQAELGQLAKFEHQGLAVTNLEMETAAIYGLASLLGHRALSCNVILAGRAANAFSPNPQAAVEKLVTTLLDRI